MKTKTEWKVGLFLAISLVVTAALVINFSKGTNLSLKSTPSILPPRTWTAS
jgi:hypothetical protein